MVNGRTNWYLFQNTVVLLNIFFSFPFLLNVIAVLVMLKCHNRLVRTAGNFTTP